MFDHVTIRVRDREESARFYDTVLGVLGIPAGDVGDVFTEWDDFSIAQADGDRPPTSGLHAGFVAPTREHVDAFWRAGTDAGYVSDGEPGERRRTTTGRSCSIPTATARKPSTTPTFDPGTGSTISGSASRTWTGRRRSTAHWDRTSASAAA